MNCSMQFLRLLDFIVACQHHERADLLCAATESDGDYDLGASVAFIMAQQRVLTAWKKANFTENMLDALGAMHVVYDYCCRTVREAQTVADADDLPRKLLAAIDAMTSVLIDWHPNWPPGTAEYIGFMRNNAVPKWQQKVQFEVASATVEVTLDNSRATKLVH